MTALVEVGDHLPTTSVGLAELAGPLGMSPVDVGIYTKFIGMGAVREAPDMDYVDLLTAAGASLTTLRGARRRVRYVVVSRTCQHTDVGLRNPAHEMAARLGLDHAVVFTLTQRFCAGTLVALDLAGRLLAADGRPDDLALVVAGEKCTVFVPRLLRGTAVMGESAAACLVSPSGSRDVLLSLATRRLDRFGTLHLTGEDSKAYSDAYVPTLVGVVRDALSRAAVQPGDVRIVLPHNVNRIWWRAACKELGIASDRVHLDLLPVTGHCFGADQLVNRADAARKGLLAPGDHYVMVAAGLGGEFAAMVLRS